MVILFPSYIRRIALKNTFFSSKNPRLYHIDLGETVITHPFFSLHNFLRQAHIHHGVKEGEACYHQLQAACLVNWFDFTPNQLLKAFSLAKTLWPIYSALGAYRLMNSINLNAFRLYYANTPNRLARYLKEYLNNNG
ncbi:hypothetical protein ELY15_12735 [Legionella sp. km772]|nr:hypothetical protein ELY15_12735 [Legionella sp. km772]